MTSEVQLLLENFVEVGGRTLLHGTGLALVTWLICATLLRKARPALHAALWTVVLFKFLVPPILPGEMALSGLMGSLASEAVEMGTGGSLSGSGLAGAGVGMVTPLAASVNWTAMLLAGYLAALLLISGTALLKSLRTFTELRRLSLAGAELTALVAQLTARLGLRRPPRIRVTNESVSPYVIGLMRPTLVVPIRLLEQVEPAAQMALLVHELAHLRRGDLLVRLAQNTVRTVFFFWPPVWWVCRRVEGFTEMACDQWAVAVSSVQPHLYAHSLLEVVRSIGDSPRASQKLAFACRGKILEERFRMILKKSKSSSPKLSWLMIPALVVWVSFALGGGAAPRTGQEEGEGVKKRFKRVEVIVAGGETDQRELLARVLMKIPEADLDGDGELTVDELKEFSLTQEGDGRYFYIRLEGDGAEPIVIGNPGDGEIHQIIVERRHGSIQEGEETIEIHANVFSGEERAEAVHQMILERHPDVNVDGDGEASPEELQQYFAERGGNVFIQKERLHLDAGEGEESDYTWTTEDGRRVEIKVRGFESDMDADGDGDVSESEARAFFKQHSDGGVEGHLMLIHKKQHVGDSDGDGDLSEEEMLQYRESQAQKRRQAFLEKHPDADLDGDGQISKTEAEALAQKLQSRKQNQ